MKHLHPYFHDLTRFLHSPHGWVALVVALFILVAMWLR
jgi:hypothetical protein